MFPAILTWNQPYRFEKVNRASLELVSDSQLVLKRLTYGFKQKKILTYKFLTCSMENGRSYESKHAAVYGKFIPFHTLFMF